MKDWRNRVREWHEVTREPGLTALLVIESLLIFFIIPLTATGALPDFVLPAMFPVLVISILVVSWHSPVAAVLVTTAVARSLANLEGVIGQLYPATLLARPVSLEIGHRRQSKS